MLILTLIIDKTEKNFSFQLGGETMSAVNLSAGSETFLGVVLVLFLVVTGVFFYLFARDAREQQKRDNEKK
jgi:hypothetical protein